MPAQSHEDLLVWQRSMDLVDAIYRESLQLPPEEIFGLRMQMRRAAVSVPSNIAEGYGRLHRGDYLRFLSVASASLRELETQLRIAQRQRFLPDESAGSLMARAGEIGRMLRGLRRSLGGKH